MLASVCIHVDRSVAPIATERPKALPNRSKTGPTSTEIEVRRGSGQLLGVSWLQETPQTLRGHLLDASGEALGADST